MRAARFALTAFFWCLTFLIDGCTGAANAQLLGGSDIPKSREQASRPPRPGARSTRESRRTVIEAPLLQIGSQLPIDPNGRFNAYTYTIVGMSIPHLVDGIEVSESLAFDMTKGGAIVVAARTKDGAIAIFRNQRLLFRHDDLGAVNALAANEIGDIA
jgi:hypothetical protein